MPVDSDREEGEIVDDFDFIISDEEDEENVRQRIQELEDKNYELEQIAQISGVYSNEYNYNTSAKSHRSSANYDAYNLKRSRKNLCYNVPSNVSSISSEEYSHSPILVHRRKRAHNKSHYHKSWREHRKKVKKHRTENHHYHHHQISYYASPPRNYESECERRLKNLREKINEELQTISTINHVSDESNDSLNRDVLRFAVARDVNSTTEDKIRTKTFKKAKTKGFRDHLETKSTFLPICTTTTTTTAGSHSMIEEEKSNEKISSEDSMSLDEQELRLIALKSAVINKHMARKKRDAEVAYSPTDFNDFLNNDEVFSADEGNVELDMTDLTVGMDISPAMSPISSSDVEIMETTVNTRPVDMDIAMSDSDVAEVVYSPVQFNTNETNNYHEIYHHEENTTDMNYVEMHNISEMIEETLPPPPPPPPIPSSCLPIFTTTTTTTPITATQMETVAESVAVEKIIEPIVIEDDIMTDNDELSDDEEEERALRALLLAKIQYKEKMEKNKTIEENNNKMKETTPTESILKQAVARLRMTSQSPIVGNAAVNAQQHVATIENIPKTVRAPLKIRSVSTINNDYMKIQQSIFNNEKNTNVVHDDNKSIVNDIIPDNTPYNANALRDISYTDNIQNNNTICTTTTTTTATTSITPTTTTTTITAMAFTSICNNNLITAEPAISRLKENTVTTTTTSIPNNKETQNKNINSTNNNNNNNKNNVTELQNNHALKDISTCKEAATPIKSQKTIINQTKNNKLINFAMDLKRKSLATLNAVRAKRARKKLPARVISTRSVTAAQQVNISTSAPTLTTTTTTTTIATNTTSNYSLNKTTQQNNNNTININNNNNNTCSRLITITPKVQVPNLIITLAADSSDDSDENCLGTGGSNFNTDYMTYDNASPISLRMDSPIGAPSSRSASPVTLLNKEEDNSNGHNNNTVTRTIVNECFQKRLDEFLKEVRTKNVPKTTTVAITKTTATTTTTTAVATTNNTATLTTATTKATTPKKSTKNANEEHLAKTFSKAVRHLPESSQREYRLLLQRMLMLEKIKLQKSMANQATIKNTNTNNTSTEAATTTAKTITTEPSVNNVATFVSANNRTLIRKVLVKNANNTATAAKTTTTKPKEKYTFNTNSSSQENVPTIITAAATTTTTTKPTTTTTTTTINTNNDAVVSENNKQNDSKRTVLQAYEKSYEKNGIVIISKINHSLEQLKKAREAKIQKLRYNQIINDLKSQLRSAQIKYTQAHAVMNKVFPSISSTTQVIATLKRRRSKLSSAAIEMGTQLNGESYRLKNDDQAIILAKSEELAAGIMEINKISSKNINNLCNDKISTTRTKTTRDNSTMTDEVGIIERTTANHASKEQQQFDEIATTSSTSIEVIQENEQNSEEQMEEEEEVGEEDYSEKFTLKPYVSPLNYAEDLSGATKRDVMTIVCPFGLLGLCRDKFCKYEHL